jgi:hypothetical protein
MTPDETPDEFEGLLMALVDGGLSRAEEDRLAELLRDFPALREKYLDYLLVDSLLRGEGPGEVTAPPSPPRPPSRRRWPLVVAAVAIAATALVAVVARPRAPESAPADAQAAEATDDTVAVLLDTAGAVWNEPNPPSRPGTPLPPGRMRLDAGIVRLEFYCGAMVIVEGPADFRLASRNRAEFARGKLWAAVPPHAQGFTIGTPTLDLVDRGTEFGVRVGGRGETEVHVFRGKVELYDAGAAGRVPPNRALTTGQGARVGLDGAANTLLPDPHVFVTSHELEDKLSTEAGLRQEAWRSAADAWRRDPALQVYFPLLETKPGDRSLKDYAGDGRSAADGVVVGGAWAAGRWAGRRGIEFRQVSDRVRFYVPGEFDSVTLAAWVRVDGLPNRNNSLLMADGWEEGELHWQIGRDGTLILGVQSSPSGRGAHYHAPGAITPGRIGQWVHLAVTYDKGSRRACHYLDGRQVSAEPIRSIVPLRLGDVELGNWNAAGYRNKNPVRHLIGCLDEFMFFSRALGPEEVGRLFAESRPPS